MNKNIILEIKKALEISFFQYPEKLGLNKNSVQYFTEQKPYKLHRPEHLGPAIIWDNGDCGYYLMGKRHRIDGPAVVNINGNNVYHIWGSDPLTIEQFKKAKAIFLKG